MKILQTLWVVFLYSCLNCEATSKGYPKMDGAYFIEGSLRGKLSNQPLPSSWDEIEPIAEIRKMDPRGSLYTMRTINSFSLVPGAPVIIKEPGISREHYGKRLFLISREEEPVQFNSPGRCVVLVDPKSIDATALRTYSYFIPEASAQLILGQIEGFDPKKTPVAFENLPAIEKRLKSENKELDDIAKTQLTKPEQRPASDRLPHFNEKATPRDTYVSLTVVWFVAILFVAGLAYRYLRKK